MSRLPKRLAPALTLGAALCLPAAIARADCGPLLSFSGTGPDGKPELRVYEDSDGSLTGAYADSPAPPGAHILWVEPGQPPRWADPSVTIDDLALGIGADGPIYQGSDRCRTPPPAPPGGAGGSLTFTEEDGLKLPGDDLEFDEDEGLETGPGGQPRDGLWQAQIGPTRIEGCPALMQQMFNHPNAPVNRAAIDEGERRMRFARPFDPNQLELSKTARVRWHPDGPNRWVTTDLGAEAFAMIPAGEGGGSHIRWEMTVLSPQEISFRRSVELVLPAEATAMLGSAPEGCRVTGTDRWVRIGD